MLFLIVIVIDATPAITDAESDIKNTLLDQYDLVIITPSEFSSNLQPLVQHKEKYNIRTMITTLDDIYSNFTGRDNPERIKYYIKHAVEYHHIKYVLLVGDITRVPIRTTYSNPGWDNEEDILTDLYYADLYDANGSFCTWDSNNNSRFGEVVFGNIMRIPINITDIDSVDLYPDVSIGRLPCTSKEEVDIVVSKIIHYETHTYNQNWFKRIILAGGDTFPISKSLRPFVYEGEITNIKVSQQLPDFTPIYLWASKRNLNAYTFNKAINQGAGFLSYSGHGFEHGWGTYKPNAIRDKMGFTQPLYYTPFVKLLRNNGKLPIMFFDACLTAKLDFNISSFYKYYPVTTSILLKLTRRSYNTSYYFPCFAWSFVIHDKGGAVASIGSTRTAYTHVDKDGVYSGAGYLNVHFFKSYHEGVTLGGMMNQALIDYINNVGRDYFTLEEFILLGDPSLRVGGYP